MAPVAEIKLVKFDAFGKALSRTLPVISLMIKDIIMCVSVAHVTKANSICIISLSRDSMIIISIQPRCVRVGMHIRMCV